MSASGGASSSSALIEVVADEVQGELSGLTEKWSSLIARCYPDAGLALDFTTRCVACPQVGVKARWLTNAPHLDSDVAGAFKRAKAGL